MPDYTQCPECHEVMDITAAAPYNRVVCPACGVQMRVKCDFGNYTLEKRHAVGGMSVVFLAKDEALDREVALKVLNDDYSGDEFRAGQFEKEAELTALISHPNVVRVYSVGRAHGRFFIAMEMVSGKSLESRVSPPSLLSEEELLKIAIQVVEGLQAAKSAGLLHRDIKPGNILVDGNGTAKIVDFGLSLVTQGGKAQAKEVFATPYYAPPEALEIGHEDFRSDMYALGATLYHALSGVPPIETKSTSTRVLREAKQKVRSLGKVAPHLTEETIAAVDKAMAFRPEDRFDSYESLKDALKVALHEVKHGGRVSREERKVRRRLGRNAGLIAVTLVLLGALVTLGLGWGRKKEAEGGGGEPVPGGVEIAQEAGVQKVAELYDRAREELEKGFLYRAEESYGKLMAFEGVQEPTGVWAGFESAMMAALDGRITDARKRFAMLGEHMESASLQSRLAEELGSVVEAWERNGRATLAERVPETAEEGLMDFAKALKNWEEGDWDAIDRLEEFASQDYVDRKRWVSPYQEYAGVIVREAKMLRILEPDWSHAWTAEEAEEQRENLVSVGRDFESRGRVRFVVESWVDWLRRMGSNEGPPDWDAYAAEIKEEQK